MRLKSIIVRCLVSSIPILGAVALGHYLSEDASKRQAQFVILHEAYADVIKAANVARFAKENDNKKAFDKAVIEISTATSIMIVAGAEQDIVDLVIRFEGDIREETDKFRIYLQYLHFLNEMRGLILGRGHIDARASCKIAEASGFSA